MWRPTSSTTALGVSLGSLLYSSTDVSAILSYQRSVFWTVERLDCEPTTLKSQGYARFLSRGPRLHQVQKERPRLGIEGFEALRVELGCQAQLSMSEMSLRTISSSTQ